VHDAGEDRLHEMAPTATKAANDPQLFSYPPKEEWWAVAMLKSQILTVHLVHDRSNTININTIHMQSQ